MRSFGIRSHSCGFSDDVQPGGGSPGQDGCMGAFVDRQDCFAPPSFWAQWSGYTQCSASCKGGIQRRFRSHPCQTGESETLACNTSPGEYGQWSQWTRCPVSCGGGTVRRFRTHNCGEPPQTETAPCNTDPGFFGQWSNWSVCTKTCGGGRKSRTQRQTCTGQLVAESSSCNDNPCAIWDGWSTWGPCSASCGNGTLTRSRKCRGGRPGESLCVGSIGAIQSVVCDAGPCCDFGWSGWSACCKNGNTLPDLQVRLRGNGCTQRWENVTRICPPGTRVLNIQCSNHNVLFASSEQRRRRRSVEVELP
uniref:Uncharacterized protein n=1 Tax=Ciona savignyi TaxID=51511 RepID=H2YHQ0_CIOSA